MEILQLFVDLFNAVIALLNTILDAVEWILSPVINIIERVNGLGLG